VAPRGVETTLGPFALDAGGDGETGRVSRTRVVDQPGPVVVDGWGVAVSFGSN